jgi:hypothetical protein
VCWYARKNMIYPINDTIEPSCVTWVALEETEVISLYETSPMSAGSIIKVIAIETIPPMISIISPMFRNFLSDSGAIASIENLNINPMKIADNRPKTALIMAWFLIPSQISCTSLVSHEVPKVALIPTETKKITIARMKNINALPTLDAWAGPYSFLPLLILIIPKIKNIKVSNPNTTNTHAIITIPTSIPIAELIASSALSADVIVGIAINAIIAITKPKIAIITYNNNEYLKNLTPFSVFETNPPPYPGGGGGTPGGGGAPPGGGGYGCPYAMLSTS